MSAVFGLRNFFQLVADRFDKRAFPQQQFTVLITDEFEPAAKLVNFKEQQ